MAWSTLAWQANDSAHVWGWQSGLGISPPANFTPWNTSAAGVPYSTSDIAAVVAGVQVRLADGTRGVDSFVPSLFPLPFPSQTLMPGEPVQRTPFVFLRTRRGVHRGDFICKERAATGGTPTSTSTLLLLTCASTSLAQLTLAYPAATSREGAFVHGAGSAASYTVGSAKWVPTVSYSDWLFGSTAAFATAFSSAFGTPPTNYSGNFTAVTLTELGVAAAGAGSLFLGSLLSSLKPCQILNASADGYADPVVRPL